MMIISSVVEFVARSQRAGVLSSLTSMICWLTVFLMPEPMEISGACTRSKRREGEGGRRAQSRQGGTHQKQHGGDKVEKTMTKEGTGGNITKSEHVGASRRKCATQRARGRLTCMEPTCQ
jgi:hypothetical protein